MLASELIRELSAEIMEHGDREVWVLGTAQPKILAPVQRVRSDTVKPVETMRLYDLRDRSNLRPPPPVEPLPATVLEL
jgi:hypothetical protein